MDPAPRVKPNWKSQEYFRTLRPQFSPCSFMTIYALVFVVLLPLGIGVLVSSSKVVEYTESYGDVCGRDKGECHVTFEVKEDMDEPVFLYYEITNMYKNHRLYMKSKDDKQLSGESRTRSELSDNCENALEIGDLWIGLNPNSTELANPCGLIANSLFNDTYRLIDESSQSEIHIELNGISWYEDDARYERYSSDWYKTQWTDVEKESFSVWMRASATSNNKKLYGRIRQSLKKDKNYILAIANNYGFANDWGAGRRAILSTSSAFGGKNYLLGGLLVAVACIAMLELIVIAVFCRNPGKDNFFPQLADHNQSLQMKNMEREEIQPDQEVLRLGDNGNSTKNTKPPYQ